MRVINKCRVDFQYKLSSHSPIVISSIYSNIASTDIIKDILKINKYVDKEYTYAFDILTYTIVITNSSKSTIRNIFFQDIVPLGTKLIENSVEINHRKKRCLNPNRGFYLNDIYPGFCTTITFKVVIYPICFCEHIRNFSTIEHNYIFNIDEAESTVKYKSNEVYSEIRHNVFKNFTVENCIEFENKISCILDVDENFDILGTKIINTPLNSIYGAFRRNICSLLVFGSIEYKIFYIENGTKILRKEVRGFSCYMLVPVGIVIREKNNIRANINTASVILNQNNKLYITHNILLYF